MSKVFIRGISHSKNGYRLRSVNKPISYATAKEKVITALMDIGLNSKDYGLHSHRPGGATAAANLGINDRLFKKHGRWKSEMVKDGYVHENLDSLLLLTDNDYNKQIITKVLRNIEKRNHSNVLKTKRKRNMSVI